MPMIFVARVRRGVSMSLATPKSVSSAGCAPPGPRGPCMSRRMFSGLTSRCTTPAACAAASASATSAVIATAASGASRCSRSRRVRRSVPRTRSMTRARSLPSTTRSRTETMWGWSRPSSAVRSWTNRPTSSWSDARSSRSSLTATGPSGPSPSHTVPALPRPRTWCAVYRLPIFRAKAAPLAPTVRVLSPKLRVAGAGLHPGDGNHPVGVDKSPRSESRRKTFRTSGGPARKPGSDARLESPARRPGSEANSASGVAV